MSREPGGSFRLPSPRLIGGLGRIAAGGVLLALGAIVLWQSGLIFGPEKASAPKGQAGPAQLLSLEATNGREVGLREGDIAPDFEFSTFDGRRMRLSELRGRPVLLNFWATWCGPCKAELPAMETSLQVHQADGLAVIAMNNGEPFEAARRYLQQLGVEVTAFGYDPEGTVARRYALLGMPTSYFIGRDGAITRVFSGALSERQLEDAVQQAVRGSAAN